MLSITFKLYFDIMMESKNDLQILTRNRSVLKNLAQFSHRRLRKSEKICSISPQSKPHHPQAANHSRPKSQINLTRKINISSYRINKNKNSHLTDTQELTMLLEKNTLNQNVESLNIDKQQLHNEILAKITHIKNIKTLLDYNFETVQQSGISTLLNTLLLDLNKGCPLCIKNQEKKEQIKTIDLTEFNRNAKCIKCHNVFLIKYNVEEFICEECNKGNILQKFNGTIAQINLINNIQKTAIKIPSQEFLNLFTDRSINVTPNRAKIRKPEYETENITQFNIILPSKQLKTYDDQPIQSTEYIEIISQIKEKGKLLSRDLLTIIQEQDCFTFNKINEIENTIGEYAKRLRIILRELNEFIPEFSQALEIIFKGYAIGIDSLIGSFHFEIKKNQEEYIKLQEKLCDQEILKNEIRKFKVDISQMNKKHTEESDYLKALIDRYKFTVNLYRKELDAKEDHSLNLSLNRKT